MKTTREELIDFMKWFFSESGETEERINEIATHNVDQYQKSINSEAGNESHDRYRQRCEKNRHKYCLVIT